MVWRYLLNQQNLNDLNDLEIIVINDDSEKEYVKILKEETAELKNIKIINLPKHKGFSAALNKGISCANGELLAADNEINFDAIKRDFPNFNGCKVVEYLVRVI